MVDISKRSQPFMALLPASVQQHLQSLSALKKYNDGQMIHSRGDIKPGLSIIRSGMARVGTMGKDGTFIEVSTLGIGHSFGEFTLFAGLPRTHDIYAVGETQIDQIPGPQFLRYYETEPRLSHALFVSTLGRTHLLLELLNDSRRLPLDAQIAKTISMMIRTEDNAAVVTLLQSDLASTLGISRYTVSKTLDKLSKRRLISVGYRKIMVPDVKALRDWILTQSAVAPL